MKFVARLLVLCLLIAAVAAAAGAGLWWWSHRPMGVAPNAASDANGVEVTIAPGSSVRAIAAQIQAAGVPLQPSLFTMLARLEGRAGRLQAGTYAITPQLTPDMLLDKMERGEIVRIQLVVPEGWTFAQMRALVAGSTALRQTVRGLSDRQLMESIGAQQSSPEGLFFPDTYVFTRGATDLDLYKRAYRALQKRLEDGWATRASDLPFASPYEALTLASIVEKETGRAEDRPQIAAVFINRLKRGMLLQTDPTVIYGIGERFDGNLHKADLTNDTPYNTYLHTGLPPTPIALVGAAALAAVLNPPRSDALYFVARGDGTSEFSANLNDHNRAVERFQRRPQPRTRDR